MLIVIVGAYTPYYRICSEDPIYSVSIAGVDHFRVSRHPEAIRSLMAAYRSGDLWTASFVLRRPNKKSTKLIAYLDGVFGSLVATGNYRKVVPTNDYPELARYIAPHECWKRCLNPRRTHRNIHNFTYVCASHLPALLNHGVDLDSTRYQILSSRLNLVRSSNIAESPIGRGF